jgi:hypothetical protein
VWALRAARGARCVPRYADRARDSIAQFQSRYPESLRVTVLPILLQGLEQVRR